MSKPYTILVTLEAKTPGTGPELDAAVKGASARAARSPGFVSFEGYRCEEGARYVNIIKWKDEASQKADMQAAGDCPVGKLIQAGKVDFRFGAVSAV